MSPKATAVSTSALIGLRLVNLPTHPAALANSLANPQISPFQTALPGGTFGVNG